MTSLVDRTLTKSQDLAAHRQLGMALPNPVDPASSGKEGFNGRSRPLEPRVAARSWLQSPQAAGWVQFEFEPIILQSDHHDDLCRPAGRSCV